MWDVRFIAFAVLVTAWLPAAAYIDPGSGSAIMSLIIGFFVALGLTVKTYWYKLKALFTRQAPVRRQSGNWTRKVSGRLTRTGFTTSCAIMKTEQ